MNILCISDIHSAVKSLQCILNQESPADLLVLGGDLEDADEPGALSALLECAQRHSENVLAVAGNNDNAQTEQLLVDMGISLHGRGQRIGELGFFGVSATPIVESKRYEFTEDEIGAFLEKGFADVRDAPAHVLVAHTPPRDSGVDVKASGEIDGSLAVRDCTLHTRPLLVISGHFHLSRGLGKTGDSLVLNCGMAKRGEYAVVEVTENREVRVELKQAFLI